MQDFHESNANFHCHCISLWQLKFLCMPSAVLYSCMKKYTVLSALYSRKCVMQVSLLNSDF